MNERGQFRGKWERITLAELEQRGDIRLFRGKVISQKDIDRLPGHYPIYSSSVHAGGLFGSYGDYMFDEELITWSIDGGGHFFYRPRHKFSVTNVCGYLRIRTSSIDYRYLAYHLQRLHSQEVFDYTMKAHPSVIRGAYRVALPQPSEQRAIAALLSDVDELIGSQEALIAKKRAIKQAAMQELLTEKTRLPGFGGQWHMVVLADIADIRNGGTPRTAVPSYWGGRIPWCVPTDITASRGKYLVTTTRSITSEGLASCGASLLPVGSLLLCSRATIGEIKIASMPVATNQGFKSIVCAESVDNEFLYYRLVTLKERMIDLATGSTFLEISKHDLAGICIDLPPLLEQRAIAAVLSDMDAEITALEQRLDKTRAIKQGMMQQLLTGSVRLPIPVAAVEEAAVLTRRELAERIGITPDGIKYHLGKLKAAGAIRRVGSDRAGGWEVLK